jgi:response regulator RpfG family c-di-GMP phosphodiesterase
MAVELELQQAQAIFELKESTTSILLIDTDPAFSIVVGIMLKMHGYSVRRAHNDQTAISILELVKPDLIVGNQLLLERNTGDLINHITEDPSLADIPVVVLLPSQENLGEKSNAKLHISAHLSKPFTAGELHNLIEKTIA